jgi:PAS domain S-box-containing protein
MAKTFEIDKPIRTRVLISFLGSLIPLFILLIVSVESLLVPSIKNRAFSELTNTTMLLRNSVQASATASIRNHLKTIADKNREIAQQHLEMVENGALTLTEAKKRLRQIFLSQQVGTSGYIYCLDSKGIAVIHPVEGVEGTDNTQFPFIHDQIRMKDGYVEYDWKNPGEIVERPKALYMSYFEPFDWIISASSYRSEFSQLLNPSDFREAVLSLKFGERGYAYVFGPDGRVLIHPSLSGINIFEQDELPTEFVREMVSNSSGYIEYNWQNPDETKTASKIAVYRTIDELEWIVVSSAYSREILKPVQIARYASYGSILLVFITSIIIAFAFSRKLTKPLEVMVQQLDKNSQHGTQHPLTITNKDELGRFAYEINSFFSVVKEQNEWIKLERARYLNLFETSPDAIYLLHNLIIVDCNPRTCELFGGTKDQIIGKSIFDLSPPNQIDGVNSKDFASRIVKGLGNKDIDVFEWKHRTLSGRIFQAEVRLKAFEGEDQKKLLVAFTRDITDRKLWEEKLFKQSSFIETLLRAVPLPVFYKDNNGTYLGCNKAFTDVMGITQDEIMGKTVHQLWPSEMAEEYHQKDIDVINNPEHQVYEFKVKNKEGEVRDVIFAKDIFYDDKGTPAGLVGAFLDITEQKRIAEQLEDYKNHLEFLVKERTGELEASNEELTAANEELLEQRTILQSTLDQLRETQRQLLRSEKMASLGVLAAGISHEINNPLNFIHGGILGIEMYLNKKLKEHIEPLSQLISAINEGISRASQIVRSLNHYSRTEDLPNCELNIHSIIENCLIMLSKELDNRIQIVRDYSTKPHLFFGNEGKLHQAILNIIQNAIHAIEGDGKIIIGTKVENKYILISFTDNGCGIEQENITKVTDPFYTTKDPGKGPGLGLSITLNIIEEHQGILEFSSQPDHGTTVIVKLPLKESDEQ